MFIREDAGRTMHLTVRIDDAEQDRGEQRVP